MCNAIIANLQASTNIGGRQSTQALQQLKTIVQARQSTQTALAQSNLALLQGDSYVRSSVAIEDDKTSVTEPAIAQLQVVPNPASNQITVYYNGIATLPATLNIFTHNGQIVKSISIADANSISLNITDLKTGLYYCQLKGTNATAKIIVIK